MSTHDDEYDGYFIPKGTIVMGSAWYVFGSTGDSDGLILVDRALLHDPQAYKDPMRFMPERYLKDGKLDPDVRDPSVAAFGYGRRICPGRHMSDTSLFLAVASTLAVFDIETQLDKDGNPVQMSGEYTNGNFQ